MEKKCGKVTISVTNNQMPLMPLFSPVYTSTRPYSQTRSNTQRDLMQPDEVLRLDRRKCIALFQGHKPALLYKLSPEEFPDYSKPGSCRVIDYTPAWRQREEQEQPPAEKPTSVPVRQPSEQPAPGANEINPAETLEYRIEPPVQSDNTNPGMMEKPLDTIRGEDGLDGDEDIPPR